MSDIGNARIARTFLGIEDHGILTFNLQLEGESWGQGFGGWTLDAWNETVKERTGTPLCADFVLAILRALDVDSWEKVCGVYVRYERREGRGPISAIGHITKDRWVRPDEIIAAWKERAA